jgi:tripartite-type tricarboxylate transporter receptor subunit TctC
LQGGNIVIARFVVSICVVGVMILGTGAASGQNYPNKPIRILTSEPGGSLDFAARLIAPGLGSRLGQQVIVDNRNSIIAVETAARAAPDGYTLLFSGSTLWLAPLMRESVLWDPVRDFAPITLAVSSPNVVVVHPSLPVKSVKELIALAKARPGELNYSTAAPGTSSHLAAELFKATAGVNMAGIPYRGAGPALNALIGGQVQLMFPNAATAVPHINSGRIMAVAVTSAQPSRLVPGVPTAAASGLPGYEAASVNAMFAPAKTGKGIVNRLNQEIVQVLGLPEVKERFFKSGVETVGTSAEELAASIRAEVASMGKVIKNAGIRAE